MAEAADELSRDGVEPDLVVLLDLDPRQSSARRTRPADRIERQSRAFFERVRAGYLELAAGDPEHWVVIEGSGTPDEVHQRVLAAVDRCLQPTRRGVSN